MGATCRVSCPVALWGPDGQRWVFSHTENFGSSHKALRTFFLQKDVSNQQAEKVEPQPFKSWNIQRETSVSLMQWDNKVLLFVCLDEEVNYVPQIKVQTSIFIFEKNNLFTSYKSKDKSHICNTTTEENFFILRT